MSVRSRKTGKRSKQSRSKSLYSRIKQCYVTDTTDIEILYLSPLTQVSVGCRIGRDITTLKPWIHVQKEKLLDHIEFYEAESEFYQIQDKIIEYPQEVMMIGSCNVNTEIKADFFLCVSIEAQQHVKNSIEIHNKKHIGNVLKSLHPVIGPWYSFGSERDIRQESNRNNRTLLAVDIETDFPIHRNNTKFHLVESVSYVELSGKSVKFVLRTRLDRSVQTAPIKTNQSCQTDTCMARHIMTQYEYIPPQISQRQQIKLGCKDELYDILNVNYHINLYENEYSRLSKNVAEVLLKPPVDKKLYQDNINCRRTKVSCLSWNSIYSGVVAVAYAKNPPLCLIKKRNLENVSDPSTETHLILIWCFEDNVRPKLYLEAGAEVTALSFCPYDGHILVAGYTNGLLGVWDLTNLLNETKKEKFLTAEELEYHILISSQIEWIKQPLNTKYLQPILKSPQTEPSPVTSILWIPPTYRITNKRQYQEEVGMQFISISLTGRSLYVWDLTTQKRINQGRAKKGRLGDRPNKLDKKPSKLQNILFTPICRLINNTPHPLIKIICRNDFYLYEENETFRPSSLKFNFDSSQKLICSTLSGCLKIIQWEDTEYEEDPRPVKSIVYETIHDGPILDCEMSSFFPEMILTVGGSVFAIWNVNMNDKQPLIWRKSLNRYQSGMWCVYHPLSVLVVRTDRFFEIWNFAETSNIPVQLFKYHGYNLIKIYGDSSKFHVRKKCFITSDALGNFKLVLLPSEIVTDENISEAKKYLEQLYRFKNYIKNLKMKCHPPELQHETIPPVVPELSEYNKSVVPELSEYNISEIKEVKKLAPPSSIERFNQKQYKEMANILRQNKGINMTQVQVNQEICRMHYELSLPKRRINPEDVLKMADEQIFQIMKSIINTNKVRRRIHVTINHDNFEKTKKIYFDSYKEVSQEFMSFLGKSKCQFTGERWCNLRKNNEIMARKENQFLKRNVTVETEVASSSP